ncbi:MAG: hypothetical protein DRI48_05315 [Chloroflexi bacterium]|nr:MAG: hypothetical protein DRI48_05315 [Chloroflexota bacterium]
MPASLEQWGDHVEEIARAGRGFVEAYEIGNEPNVEHFWGGTPPDPAQYVQVLEIAHQRIKAVDPSAIVVSAGLAPVGRIEGNCNGWSGNDCGAMDEREYARHMFLLGAGDHFDAFGYHPYGFAYPPDTDPALVSNGFAFRGAEVMHDLMKQFGLDHKPMWATEFSWLRDPSADGALPGRCHRYSIYEDNFGWMEVPELRQAAYLTRAFQYADENWPWMGAMFVWNLDWYDYGWLCEPARYFSVLKIDYTDYDPYRDPPPAPYTTTLAYEALAAMEKRPGHFGPRLAIKPSALSFLADVDEPRAYSDAVVPLNTGYGVFTWTATVMTGMRITGTMGTGTLGVQITPTLAMTTGLQGMPISVTVDSTGYSVGTFIGLSSVTATTTDVLDAPQVVSVMLRVVPQVHRVYLPLTLRLAP